MHDTKIESLKNIVEENQGKSILITYNYKSCLLQLKKPLKIQYMLKINLVLLVNGILRK